MRYEEAMKYITEVGNFGSNYGLERTFKLLEFLGNPQEDLKLIQQELMAKDPLLQ